MKTLGFFIIAIIVSVAYYFFSPSLILKRAAEASMAKFAAAVASHDPKQVSATLSDLLADDANIHLSVNFLAIVPRPAMEQKFDKQGFIQFIDLTIYPLTEYQFEPRSFSVTGGEGDVHEVEFSSKSWADGANMMGGVSLSMRFSTDADCKGTIKSEHNKNVKLQSADCTLKLLQVPKPGEVLKIKNPEGLNDLLMK
jgi:hypothetical protein